MTPKTIICKVLVVSEEGVEKELAGASRSFANELSERENGRRVLELASEQLPPEKSKSNRD